MLAIIVPAHNEQDHIDDCLASLHQASRCQALAGEEVQVIVVLDDCSDRTGWIARSWGAHTIDVQARNVGVARKWGAEAALHAGARWLACTDADSTVATDWLAAQVAQSTDAVCGTVAVDDWGAYGERLQRHWQATYQDSDGHAHIHGANFGVSANAYRAAGGFPPLACSEDVALVRALQANGASIAWTAAPRVVTSVRPAFRAPGGFGAILARMDQQLRYAA